MLQKFLKDQLSNLKSKNLLRSLKNLESAPEPQAKINGQKVLLFSSNNYLGLSNHPKVIEAAIKAAKEFGVGAGASRLLAGNFKLYEELEKNLAEFKKEQAAAVFSSGYLTNIGLISSLCGEKDLIIMDKLNHASLIDAAKLSKATLRIYPHKNTAYLKKLLERVKTKFAKTFIITDGVFSMDGDIAPLPEILELAKHYGATVILDDAHGGFVLGKNGRGTFEYFRIQKNKNLIQIGTLSKALGSLGGFVVGSKDLIAYLHNKARSFIYSTALPAPILAASIASLKIAQEESWRREQVLENADFLRKGLKNLGFNTLESKTQIIPILIGETKKTLEISEHLLSKKIFAPAIRPPTVPINSSRLRISLMATHTKKQIQYLVKVFKNEEENHHSFYTAGLLPDS